MMGNLPHAPDNYDLIELMFVVAEVRFVGSMVWFNCPYCGAESAIRRWVYNQNQVRGGKAGPYCSKSCSVKDRPKGWASKKVGDLNVISEL